ncbi:uncharacterized protein LOC122249473 [Penaeus japonicus]|uniref:uncharacterized protein LOC122249473 n=1 Tax=Penaeus japonicus TaxID=27405 RepID=UPI001C70EC42|nr:uncharacterized protein LOC122249473 [Penaeus japonicus]
MHYISILRLVREDSVLMAHFMALFLLGTLHSSSGIVIRIDKTTPDPTEIERCRSKIMAVPQLNLTRHHASRSLYGPVTEIPEVTIKRPDILEDSPSTSGVTPKRPRPYLSSTPLDDKLKVATLPEEPRVSSPVVTPLATLLTTMVTTPSAGLGTSTVSIEPLTPTWYITSPPPSPLTVHTPTQPVHKQSLAYTTKPQSTNKPTLLTRQPVDVHSQFPTNPSMQTTEQPFIPTPKQPVTQPPTQPASRVTGPFERDANDTLTQPLLFTPANSSTYPALLLSTLPAVRERRRPALVRPMLQELEKELNDLLRVQIPALLTDDIAEALNMSYRARLQFANHEMVDKVLQQDSFSTSRIPGECPLHYYKRRVNLLKRVMGILLLALPHSLQELEEAAWDEDLENNFFRPGEKNILDVQECRTCYMKDTLGRCREVFFCKSGSSADIRTGLTPEDLRRILAIG